MLARASMKVGLFHPGTQHSWQVALALQQLDRLAWFATSIFYKPNHFPYRLERLPGPIGQRLRREFSRFRREGIDPSLVRTAGLAEWFERIARRAGMRQLARQLDAFGNHRFAAQLGREIGSDRPFALWGFNTCSLEPFEQGRAVGRPLILDRTIGDFRGYNALMDRVAEDYGDWFIPTERRIPEQQIELEQREYELADTILCGSEFCAGTVVEQGGNELAGKVRVLPYCYDEALFADMPPPAPRKAGEPVRFLFLGQINPRKGAHHVLEAIERIPASAASLTIVGDMRIPRRIFARFADRVTWIPTVPRAEIPAITAAHDVLLLPSYFEGAGIVLYEALAAGCGLIQTRHCAPAVTADTGIMLETIDTDCLHAAMMAAVEDRNRLDHWRSHAQAEAANYTFDRYRENIAALLADMQV